MISQMFATTAIEATFTRNLEKEVRGTMNGLQNVCSSLAAMCFVKVGGYMSDIYGAKSPFLLVAVINLVFIVPVIILCLLGKFKH